MTKKCKTCGIVIPEGRVKALPHTQTCIEHSDATNWKVNVITIGNVDKDEHYQEIQIIKDPSTYEELQNYRKQMGNYSK